MRLLANMPVPPPTLYLAVNVFDPAVTVITNAPVGLNVSFDAALVMPTLVASAAAIVVAPDTANDMSHSPLEF